MKKLVLYGDGILSPSHGYGESLIDLLVMRRPEAVYAASFPGEEELSIESAARDVPVLIGKAPDLIYLGLGSVDMLRGADPAAAVAAMDSLVQLLLQKTRAQISVGNLCEAFLPQDARAAASEFNAGLARLAGERVKIIDLNTPVNIFFERHRRGDGEKRSLYEGSPPRLTSMGRVFLSHAAYGQLGLEEFFPG